MSNIEWTQETWNPTTGCDRVSPGCDNCYALTLAKRLKAMGSEKYQTDGDPRTSGPGFGVATHDDTLSIPLRWRKPRTVFVNSMSDLFHAKVPVSFVKDVFDVMAATPQHTYQVLTKRAHRLARIADQLTWPANVWMGVSAEDQARADERIPALLETPAAVKFVSAEPLLGKLDLSRWLGVEYSDMGMWLEEMFATVSGRGSLLDWVIVGGESGPGARPLETYWVEDLVDQCQAAGTAVFVKQMGSVWAADHGDRSKGNDMSQWSERLRVRQMPAVARG